MTSVEIRKKFLDFFQEKGHTIIASASLVPENDPTVLFTTAGMHPLVPYLLGQKHPSGARLANVQKCVRVQDIDEVGDNRHDTFFEMLGNWSLGDYFKKEAIVWSWEFLTDKKWLGIDPQKIGVSVFGGDADAERDEESAALWRGVGVNEKRIAYLGKEDNWWPAGGKHPGPQGPDTEMFVWVKNEDAPEHFDPSNEGWIEVWNNVFMQFNRSEESVYVPLSQQNVDTGMGLERMAMVLQGKSDVFETDLFLPIMGAIQSKATKQDLRASRIVADHIRTATFMMADGVLPSNTERGYVLRRLVRRAVRFGNLIGLGDNFAAELVPIIVRKYSSEYPELAKNENAIVTAMREEEAKFIKTLARGLKELEQLVSADVKTQKIDGQQAFTLFSTFGFPLEMTKEIAAEKGLAIDEKGFWSEFEKHQELSRTAASGAFKGGLADHSAETTRLHTATHLLHATLRKVLGDHVFQKGSNITAERLRFDFSHPEKVMPDQLAQVEAMINKVVADDMPVSWKEMTFDEAKQAGALGLFESKYGEKVKVYSIGDYSKEVCGGPHVEHTAQIGHFRITREEAVAAGIRRIKAEVS